MVEEHVRIGVTETLRPAGAMEFLTAVVRRPAVGSIFDFRIGRRFFDEIPQVSGMEVFARPAARRFFRLDLDCYSQYGDDLNETVLQRFVTEAPASLGFSIQVALVSGKRRGFNAMFSANWFAVIGLDQHTTEKGKQCEAFVSWDTCRLGGTGKVQSCVESMLTEAGLGKDEFVLDARGELLHGELLTDSVERAGEGKAVLGKRDYAFLGERATRLSCGAINGLVVREEWEDGRIDDAARRQFFGLVNRWRAVLPKVAQMCYIRIYPSIANWNEDREWVNKHVPGPFGGLLDLRTREMDLERLMMDPWPPGEYVELRAIKVRGRVVIVAAISEANGWRFYVTATDPVPASKIPKVRAEFERLLGMPGVLR